MKKEIRSVQQTHPLGFLKKLPEKAHIGRRNVIRDLLQAEAPEEVIKSIIRPEIEEGQVLQKKKMWMEMEGK